MGHYATEKEPKKTLEIRALQNYLLIVSTNIINVINNQQPYSKTSVRRLNIDDLNHQRNQHD